MPSEAQIMIVDDDAGSRIALTRLLEDEGFSVVAYGGGAEALARLRRGPLPKLIVLDLVMPGTDGWDVRDEQRRDPALVRIPVFSVSAVGKLVDADQTFRKPLEIEPFLTAIRLYVTPARPERRS